MNEVYNMQEIPDDLREFFVRSEIGLEQTPDAFVAELVAVFREVRRVLKDDGTCWLNLGDSYNAAGRQGHGTRVGAKQGTNRASANGSDNTRPSVASLKQKDLIGIPWMVAFAMRADGWYLRQDIIWHKPNPMPESVQDRCTKAHEYVFLLSKGPRYFFDAKAISEPASSAEHHWRYAEAAAGYAEKYKGVPGQAAHTNAAMMGVGPDGTRNRRSVWTVATQPYSGAHFATMAPALAELCIKAGSRLGDVVLDPFAGAGTTLLVAERLGRSATGIELNPSYAEIARRRIYDDCPMFANVEAAE